MRIRKLSQVALIACLLFYGAADYTYASAIVDTDGDGLSDTDEVRIYHSDPAKTDTDGDGYRDGDEIAQGFSPLKGKKMTLLKSDTDNDGLSDSFEIDFGTDILEKDSDGDGFGDKNEIVNGYDPRTAEPTHIEKSIHVAISTQRMQYKINDSVMATYVISSGTRNMPTPMGEFPIINKAPRAWSKLAGLWMPYWMGFAGGKFGIHDLPEWPGGKKEGVNHLGTRVSHGCIRLGTAQAKEVYAMTPVGTKLFITN